MKRQKTVLAALAGAVALAAALVAVVQARARATTDYVAARRGPVVEAVYGLGTVTAARSYNLKIGITSHVVKEFVKEGDQVARGQPLVQLYDAGIQTAPFAGTVTAVAYKIGETVFPQTPVVSLVDLAELYVVVALEQQAALHVRPGQIARLSFESLRGERLEGKVRSIYPSEGQFLVRIDLERFPKGVLPGMTADVAVEVARREAVLLVPVNGLSAGKLIIAREGRQKKIDIKVGTVDGEWAEVLEGAVEPGDLVAVQRK